jgi:hypothetical protein
MRAFLSLANTIYTVYGLGVTQLSYIVFRLNIHTREVMHSYEKKVYLVNLIY